MQRDVSRQDKRVGPVHRSTHRRHTLQASVGACLGCSADCDVARHTHASVTTAVFVEAEACVCLAVSEADGIVYSPAVVYSPAGICIYSNA